MPRFRGGAHPLAGSDFTGDWDDEGRRPRKRRVRRARRRKSRRMRHNPGMSTGVKIAIGLALAGVAFFAYKKFIAPPGPPAFPSVPPSNGPRNIPNESSFPGPAP